MSERVATTLSPFSEGGMEVSSELCSTQKVGEGDGRGQVLPSLKEADLSPHHTSFSFTPQVRAAFSSSDEEPEDLQGLSVLCLLPMMKIFSRQEK